MRRTGTIRQVAGLMAGDHVCWSYLSDADHRRVLAAFLDEGIREGQRLVYMAPPRDLPRAAAALRLAGHDPEQLVANGALVLATVDEVYGGPDGFDPDAQLGAFRGMVAEALADGYSGLRACAECAGLLQDPAVRESWAVYELRADLMAMTIPLVGMCAYDLRVADKPTMDLLAAVHPLHLTRNGSSEMTFHVFGSDGSLAFGGEIDFLCSDVVGDLVEPCLADLQRATFDLSALRFADLAGVRTIARAAQRLSALHARVELLGASPLFRRVWTLADLDSVVRVVMR